jgi:hypothetical protein
MSKQVFVFTDLNYGASKTATTAEVATDPSLLRNGALGIYGIDPVSSNNAHKLALITDGGSDAAGKVPAASFKGKNIFIAQGTSDGVRMSNSLKITGLDIVSAAYAAPVLGVAQIGYNGTSGSLDEPATLAKGDEILLKVINRNDVEGNKMIGKAYSGYAVSNSSTIYDILVDLVTKAFLDADRLFEPEIIANGTSAAVTASTTGSAVVIDVAAGTPTVTGSIANGSKTLTFAIDASTFSASQVIAVGDYIQIAGDLYRIDAQDFTTSSSAYVITLDRVFRGTTLSAAAASNFKFYSVDPTEFGLELTDAAVDYNLIYSVDGIISTADITYGTAAVPGNGTYAHLLKMEKDFRPHRGELDNLDRRVPLPSTYADSSTTYDYYVITCEETLRNTDSTGHADVKNVEVVVAFPSTVADTGGKNQSNFEDIMVQFYADLVTLF